MSENDEVAGAMDRMAQELYQDIKQVSPTNRDLTYPHVNL
jgi:hypothetical protein